MGVKVSLLYCRKSLFPSAGISVCYHLWWKTHNGWYGMWFCFIFFYYESFLRSFNFTDTFLKVSRSEMSTIRTSLLKLPESSELLLLCFWKWKTREREDGGKTKSGFYPSTFLYSRLFPKIEFFLMFAKSVGHRGEIFWNVDLQIAGRCISNTLFDSKAHIVHRW